MSQQKVDNSLLSAPPVLTKSYDSGDQTITSAGTLTLAHGLGAAPKFIQCLLHCVTGEAGYTAGDFLVINPHMQTEATLGGGTPARGVVVVPDATNINIRFGANSAAFGVIAKDTGNSADGITNGNWKFVVRAYA